MSLGVAMNPAGRARRLRPLGLAAGGLALALAAMAGCGSPLRFPAEPAATNPTDAGLLHAYDLDGDGRPDYFTIPDAAGRVVRIAYDTNSDGRPDSFVDLDAIPAAECRHVVLILDGIGYDTVEEFQRAGRLRLFHPPARLLSTFPAMTDIALADVFQSTPCIGLEAVHFDHQANRIVGGDADYLSMKNEDWARFTDYRAGTLTDPLAYLYPNAIFRQELGDLLRLFDRRDRPLIVAYFVSTAGLGTREGLDGQRKVLDAMDRLSQELVWKTRGLVKITMLSDHGHALARARRIEWAPFLVPKGWRVTDRLEEPRDVAPIEYGIITYASFATRDRPALAATLLEHPGVDLVTYTEGDSVVVERAGANGRAAIERRGSRYRYRAAQGDPLELAPVIEKMAAENLLGADGFADDREWLRFTVAHRYPDALDRLWRVFHGQTEHVPDVIASLKEGYCAGSASRAFWLPYIASTHGDLERKSSTAFIVSTAGPIATRWPLLRHRDAPQVLRELTGRPWPPERGGGAQ